MWSQTYIHTLVNEPLVQLNVRHLSNTYFILIFHIESLYLKNSDARKTINAESLLRQCSVPTARALLFEP